MTAPTESSPPDSTERPVAQRGSAGEVFGAFLKLGFTSFGGPIAHLGYFREEFVARRRWLDDQAYADLVALCQFLPGPASSQVGFALGLMRGGPLGAAAAWTAFTLPSALALILFALGAASLTGPTAAGALQGLKLVAVAVVAQALWGMARSLCPNRERATIALAAVAVVVFAGGALGQVAAIVLGGLAGLALCRNGGTPSTRPLVFSLSRRTGLVSLAAFFALLFGLPLLVLAVAAPELAIFDAFYRAGALVFGGGHVVLPLLQAEVVPPGWVSGEAFLAGYGAAQAVPGPLFTFAAYLGAGDGAGPRWAGDGGHRPGGGLPARLPAAARHPALLGRPARAPRLPRPRWPAPTPPWSASSAPRSTTRSGQAPCARPATSPWRSRASCC